VGGEAGRRRHIAFIWVAIALAAAAFVGALLVRRRRGQSASRASPRPHPPQPRAVLGLEGLTEEQAEARRLEGQDNAILFKPPHSPREILRRNTLTIFNLSLVGLALVQVLLRKPLDAVLTIGVLALGIGLNVGQEAWARGRLKRLERSTRPQATVIRESTVRSIDPSEVVRGDILVVGPGDQILADGHVLGEGKIVVDESMLTGDSRQDARGDGDPVYAGSFCVAGHGAYDARKVGSERLIASLTDEFQAVEEEQTPLERAIDRLLRVLLVVVTVLSLLLLADFSKVLFPRLHVDAVASAASVIFGLAPAGLLLMIQVNYAMGTADLARVGALVHRSRSVEALAQATVVFFAQEGILTGVGVEMEPAEPAHTAEGAQPPRLGDSRVRQILGSFARSTSAENPMIQAMRVAFEGGQRHIREEAPFLSLYGWSAVAFDDDDLRGVYVLGGPDLLDAHLVSGGGPTGEVKEDEPPLASWTSRLTNLGRTLGLSGDAAQGVEGNGLATEPLEDQDLFTASAQGGDDPQPGLFLRVVNQANAALRRNDSISREAEAIDGAPAEGAGTEQVADQRIADLVYLMAYRPELAPLHAADGTPRLPEDLIPLCRLRYSEQVHPDAVEAVQTFTRTGVDLKVLTSDVPERAALVLEQAGMASDAGAPERSISGPTLATLDADQLALAAAENTIFDQVTPDQERQVVAALRKQGKVLAVIGDGVTDLQAMRQAHLSITRQSSSPATLSIADIVLLEDSAQALQRVLDKGQRIGNGLLDILKLYLTQISYALVLILAIWGMGLGFPYQSKQGSLIAIGSVILPSVGLSLWAPPGVLPRTRLGWLLAGFVAPAAVTMSAAGVVVYRLFLDRSGDIAYAQLALTWMLTISGLVLVVLFRPPVRPKVDVDERSGDWRPTALVLVLLVLLFVVASIPLADQVFGLKLLQEPLDYVVILLAVLAWVLTTLLVWRVRPMERLLRYRT
jgi:magnesium-transporting ATPase (P-type)